ncbi:uncharacterized protein LOC126835030 [Adelges cooleyi]|uniref:uncharacterized protein LOC126835030 n=1 Tax=Adelges cooleyi TaxID=133065 RepID=UPI0021809402|nr:uncharacterized protein LOC126835030 [Adelges cooleyi]
MVDVQDLVKNNFAWHNNNGYKSGKTYNLLNYFTNLDDSRKNYLHYQMTKPLTVQTQNDSPCKSDSPQPFYHMHQDSVITQNSSPIPVRFSPRMGSNAINYARSSASIRVSLSSNISSISSSNIEQSITKISAMFPTATETHIRALLNKYHNREAVVISALQVEKHPIATPGPYTPPPINRHYMSQTNQSPTTSPSPKPVHYSPKMKLRYLKSVFPVVEETVLLDTLCGADNNVNQATETLLTMGFNKGLDFTSIVPQLPRVTLINNESDYDDDDIFWLRRKALPNQFDKINSTCPSKPVTTTTTVEIKTPVKKITAAEELKKKELLQKKYESLEEKIIVFALESTDYNEQLADQILKNHLANESELNDSNRNLNHTNITIGKNVSLCEEIKVKENDMTDSAYCEKKSDTNLKQDAKNVPKSGLAKGPNKNLLSKKDSTCNTTVKTGIKAKGPNKSLLSKIQSLARGPNSDLKKGPSKGLAKGSIFQRLFKKSTP